MSTGTTTLAAGAGTEPYIAPEVADASRGGAAVSASDLFSFGVTMVAVLLPTIFRDVMPGTTAGVMQLFADGDEGLARTLLLAAKASDIYGEPAAASHDLEVRTSHSLSYRLSTFPCSFFFCGMLVLHVQGVYPNRLYPFCLFRARLVLAFMTATAALQPSHARASHLCRFFRTLVPLGLGTDMCHASLV